MTIARSDEDLPPPPATTVTVEHEVTAADQALLAVVSHRADSGQTVTSISHDGAPLVALCRAAGQSLVGDEYVTHLFYLEAPPPVGTALMTASLDPPADSVVLTVVAFAGDDTQAPIADSACEDYNQAGTPGPLTLQASVSSSPCHLVFAAATIYIDNPDADRENDLQAQEGVTPWWKELGTRGYWNTISVGGARSGRTGTTTIGWIADVEWASSLVAISIAPRP